MIVLIGGGIVTAVPAAAGPVDPAVGLVNPAAVRLASFDSQMLSLVNGARSQAGVPALRSAGGLTQLAVWWSNQMATGATGYQLQHNPNAWTMVTRYGASNRTAWAENVAAFSASASAQAVFDAYMGSPDHRANILHAAYRYVGIGTMSGSKGAFNTMEFTDRVDGAPAASPKPTTSAAAPTRSATTSRRPTPTHSTSAAPATRASIPAAADPGPTQRASTARPSTSPRSASSDPSSGTVLAAFGSLPVAGVTFAIRGAACRAAVSHATTGRDGRAAVTAAPGSYCAVAVAVPRGVRTPDPVRFTVRAGHGFQVTVDHLEPVTIWWRTRGTWLTMPI